MSKKTRTGNVVTYTRAGILARADAAARDLGVSRQAVFKMLDRGELHGTVAEMRLAPLRFLLGKNMKSRRQAKKTKAKPRQAPPAVVTGTDPCVCGHAPEEHGHDPDYPGSTSCRVCTTCIAYEASSRMSDTAPIKDDHFHAFYAEGASRLICKCGHVELVGDDISAALVSMNAHIRSSYTDEESER